jgi:hypothetical protein
MTAVSNPRDAPVDIMETISGSGFQSGPKCELVGVDGASGLSLAPATAFNATKVTTDLEIAPSSSSLAWRIQPDLLKPIRGAWRQR